MYIDGSANTGVEHRDAKRLIVLHESDMGDVAGVQDRVDRGEVVAAARRLTPYVRPLNDPSYVAFNSADAGTGRRWSMYGVGWASFRPRHALPYSSCRRHHSLVSLRPSRARATHAQGPQ